MRYQGQVARPKRSKLVEGAISLGQTYWLPFLAIFGLVVVLGVLWLALTRLGGTSKVPPYHWDFVA